MLYIMGDYVHTHGLTQLNTLSLHTHTDTHKPKRLNVRWSNTFCVNSSFLLPKQTAPLLLQHAQCRHSRCPAAADCGDRVWVLKILRLHAAANDKKTNPSRVGPVVAEHQHIRPCSGTKENKCELVVAHLWMLESARFWAENFASVSSTKTSFGSVSASGIGPA